MTPLECEIIVGGIPEGAISRKVGLIWGIPVKKDLRDAIMARAHPWRRGVTTETVHERREYSGLLTMPSAAGPRPVKEELHILVTGGWSAAPGYCLRLTSAEGQQVTRRIDWKWE